MTKSNPNDDCIRVIRGNHTESTHRLCVAVVNLQGELIAYVGEPRQFTYARSSAKPLQAAAVLGAGAASHFALTPKEIALLCASHNGEVQHVETAEALLHKLRLDTSLLQCGIHPPYHQGTRRHMYETGQPFTPLHNNCSGKHIGMLALNVLIGGEVEHYMQREHPVQQRMLETISTYSTVPIAEIELATDGCDVPVFAMPLNKLALAYSRFGQPDALPQSLRDASEQIIAALRSHPFYLAGSDRFDTRLIEVTQGRWIGKMGAEGVFAMTNPQSGIGIAIKITDGSERALYPSVVEVLVQLDLLTNQERSALTEFHTPKIHNHRRNEVGRIVPSFQLVNASN